MRSRTSLQNYLFVVELCHSNTWGISSVGRAFEWHSKGQRFNSAMLHHLKSRYHISGFFNINACSPKKILKKVKLELKKTEKIVKNHSRPFLIFKKVELVLLVKLSNALT